MGIVPVAFLAAWAPGVPPAETMTSTFESTSSAASAGSRSAFPSADLYSIVLFRPSIQPSSRKLCLNASSRCLSAEGVFTARNPIRRIFLGGCASTEVVMSTRVASKQTEILSANNFNSRPPPHMLPNHNIGQREKISKDS